MIFTKMLEPSLTPNFLTKTYAMKFPPEIPFLLVN